VACNHDFCFCVPSAPPHRFHDSKTSIPGRLAILASSLPPVKCRKSLMDGYLTRYREHRCLDHILNTWWRREIWRYHYLLDQKSKVAITILVVQLLICAHFCNFWVLCLCKSKHHLPRWCTACPRAYLLARGLYTAFGPYGTALFYLLFVAFLEMRSHTSKPNLVDI